MNPVERLIAGIVVAVVGNLDLPEAVVVARQYKRICLIIETALKQRRDEFRAELDALHEQYEQDGLSVASAAACA